MPSLSKEGRAQGAFTNDAEPWPDHDWSVPTDMATLRHRVLPTPDQTRYGPGPRSISATTQTKD